MSNVKHVGSVKQREGFFRYQMTNALSQVLSDVFVSLTGLDSSSSTNISLQDC